jgi:hypothetical protein
MPDKVYIVLQHFRIPEVPEDLEIEATTIVAVRRSETTAQDAIKIAKEELVRDFRADEPEAEDEDVEDFMGEYRFEVTEKVVLA